MVGGGWGKWGMHVLVGCVVVPVLWQLVELESELSEDARLCGLAAGVLTCWCCCCGC